MALRLVSNRKINEEIKKDVREQMKEEEEFAREEGRPINKDSKQMANDFLDKFYPS